jgi:hypothetical protein
MKRTLFIYMAVGIFTSINLLAQSSSLATRFQKQHMKKTEIMLVEALKSTDAQFQSSALQTLRQLQYIYPDEPFESLIEPLTKLVENENGDTQVRMLAAIALDGLHSDKGDESIKKMADSSKNPGVQSLCSALRKKVPRDLEEN